MGVRVFVPATTANLGSGYDILGMALDLGNIVEMSETSAGVKVEIYGEGKGILAEDSRNLIYQAAEAVWKKVGYEPKGIVIRAYNKIPLARGLGSSAAAVVGGIIAANQLAGGKLSNPELLAIATEFEGHPDNVAPALFGGLVISYYVDSKVQWYKLEPPKDLQIVLAVPDYQLSTKKARQVLPNTVQMEDVLFNLSRVSLLIAAFTKGDYNLLREGMKDRLHQPYRSSLMPGIEEVFAEAEKAGAVSVAVSGAGPTIIAWANGNAEVVGRAMEKAFENKGVKSHIIYTNAREHGAALVS